MSDTLIDISLPIHEGATVWPGSTGIHLDWTLRVERGEPSNLTRLDTDIHAGTHVEAGLHSFSDGTSIDQIPLDRLIGPAFVVYLPDADAIGAKELEQAGVPEGTVRTLFHTRNSKLWERGETRFQKDFVGLTSDGAKWLVNQGVQLVGVDYLSVACYDEGPQVHEILLKNGVVLVEGLNLTGVAQGLYQLVCLPIKLLGTEGAPARAVIMPVSQ